jgi:hypothetical protein
VALNLAYCLVTQQGHVSPLPNHNADTYLIATYGTYSQLGAYE